MRIQGLLRKTTPGTHWRADRGRPIQQWWVRSALLLACVVSVVSAQAGTIIGGSNLLDDAGLDLLESWLGEGELEVTNIFTKGPESNTSAHFHAAVDGKGRTFSLIEVVDLDGNQLEILGGYNPESWHIGGGYNINVTNDGRVSFIFNLTSETVFYQRDTSYVSTVDNDGQFQAYNDPDYGPSFGGGFDLGVLGNLNQGYGWSYSYGPHELGYDGGNIAATQQFSVSQIEVFTIASASPAVVPIPAPAALGLLGMVLIACKRRVRKGSSQA